MALPPSFFRFIDHLSPKAWLVIAVGSFFFVVGSGSFLYAQLDDDQKEGLLVPFDVVSRFFHDTIRLTFKTDRYAASVFVAPQGILDPSERFTWVEQYRDFVPQSEGAPSGPTAPPRLLDPEWNPVFSGAQE